MSDWRTDTTASSFNANQQISNQTSARNRVKSNGGMGYDTLMVDDHVYGESMTDQPFSWSAYEGQLYGEYTGNAHPEYVLEHTVAGMFGYDDFEKKISGYNIIGINGNEVPRMREAIEEYVQNIQTYLEEAIVATEDQIAKAFRGGEAEAAVKQYLEKVKAYVHNVVSTLNAFSDKLADVGNAWVKAQSNIASNVNTSTGSFSEGNTYSTTVQYGGPSR